LPRNSEFAFESVGAIFWARFEELMGDAISVSARSMLADAYETACWRISDPATGPKRV
jgi:hypothetical protein